MAYAIEQTKTGAFFNVSGDHTLTFDSTPDAGNLLICGKFTRDQADVAAPTGWIHAGYTYDTTNLDYLHVWVKESDGTETSVTVSITSVGGQDVMFFAEVSGFAPGALTETGPRVVFDKDTATASDGTPPQ